MLFDNGALFIGLYASYISKWDAGEGGTGSFISSMSWQHLPLGQSSAHLPLLSWEKRKEGEEK